MSSATASLTIGRFFLPNNVFVAPMAGVTDLPFRKLCKSFGAAYAVSEMVTSRKDLWESLKTSRRLNHEGESEPIAVQIAGTDAHMMAQAAAYNIDRGAQIININMGCPAKKVCNKWAGSALMQDEKLALQIITAVVQVAAPRGVPVTLKMRTGWCAAQKNALPIALAAEDAGIQMLTIHGRTREQGYAGAAEYDSIAQIKSRLRIPLVANGDIDSPQKARAVLAYTAADAVMLGRAALGRPWLFAQVVHYLRTGQTLAAPLVAQVRRAILAHLLDHYALYGEATGVRSARKHIGWYVRGLPGGEAFRQAMNAMDDARMQYQAVEQYFDMLAQKMDRLPQTDATAAAVKQGKVSQVYEQETH